VIVRCIDALIIGGGPAGASAAITLAQAGWETVLVEAKAYPREMLCGEFLSPECRVLLAGLGVGTGHDSSPGAAAAAPATAQAASSLRGAVPIHTVRFHADAGRAVWEAALPGPALGVSRSELDACLAERARAAGVDLWEGCQVSEVSGRLGRVFESEIKGTRKTSAGQTCIRARVVVGAYGKRSALDHALGRSFIRKAQPFVALKAHFRGPPLDGRIEMHAFPGGYCGVSEIEGDQRNVCLLVRQPVFQRYSQGEGEPAQNFITWMRTQTPTLDEWLKQAEPVYPRWLAIAQVPFTAKESIAGDILMAGDAAGLIAPLAGDGIAMALESGQMAGQHLMAFLSGERDAESLRRTYSRAWQRKFSLRMGLGRQLQPLLLDPAAAKSALRLLAAFPPLGSLLIRWTRGNLSPPLPWTEHQDLRPANREGG